MSGFMGNQNSFNNSASTMGGGGFQSYQEQRGPNGPNSLLGGGFSDADFLRRLKEMGIDISRFQGNGGSGQRPNRQPAPQAANWAFPQYTQSWLPPPPSVPPMTPTPPFKGYK